MNFVTISFVAFFLPVLCIGWLLRVDHRLYKWFLLLVSLVFYYLAAGAYIMFLFLVALLNWGCVRLMDRRGMRKRFYLVSITVALHVLMLAFFKYYEPAIVWSMEFFGEGAACLLPPAISSLVMPLGFSFFTFQGLSYTIDHYRDDGLAPRSYADVLCYVSFFPTVMSGPIMREEQFFPQLRTSYAGEEDFSEGMTLVLSGLFKKVVLATYLQMHLVDGLFSAPCDYTSAAALVGVYAYTMQIYCDFSGYTDIAMGIGRLMGFHLPKNFDAPYRSLSLQEFWHRWHISLSTWLRDYLYIPLGGSRRGNRYLNLIITMLIGGLWHGSSLCFVIWGGCHGLGLAFVHAWHRLTGKLRLPVILSLPGKLISWLLTLHVVAVLWVFFRADSVETALSVLQQIGAGVQEGVGFPVPVVAAIVLVLVLQFMGGALRRGFARAMAASPWVLQALVAGLLGALILNMGPDGTLPFIYTRF